jgi:hypothetical protein
MNSLNDKIKSSSEDKQERAIVSGGYSWNAAANAWNKTVVNDNGALSVDIHGGSAGSGDLKARSDIADPATSTFLKCNADGTLEMTAELDSSGLAKEETLVHVFNKVSLTADRTFAIMNRQLGASGEEVQHAKVMGSEDGATTGIQHQLAVDSAGHLKVYIDDMNPDVAVNSGLSTAVLQTDGNAILTDGSQRVKCYGNFTGTDVQIKVDANGVVETSGGGGGGGSADSTAANQVLTISSRNYYCG